MRLKEKEDEQKEDRISHSIIGAAIEVHTQLGPGLLESVYEICLSKELASRDLKVERQVPVSVTYKNEDVGCGLRLDMLVEESVIVELKAVQEILPIHIAQAMTYLKLTGKKLCLLLNFNVVHFREGGIRRVVWNL